MVVALGQLVGVGLVFIDTLDKRVKLEVVLGPFRLRVGWCSDTQQHFGLVPGRWGWRLPPAVERMMELHPQPRPDFMSQAAALWSVCGRNHCVLISVEWEASHC